MNLLNYVKRIFSPASENIPPNPFASLPCFDEFSAQPSLRSLADSVIAQHIIQDGGPNATRWAESLAQRPELRNVLRAALSGQILVDLGSSEHWQEMHRLAKEMGVVQYVAVDKFWPTLDASFRRNRRLTVIDTINDAQCKALLVKGDALEFVSQLKAQSCCVTLNGFDGAIVMSAAYHHELAKQIERVVPAGGVAFGIVSHALSLLATRAHLDAAPESFDDPLVFSAKSMTICCQPGTNANANWDDHSLIPFDRLLIRK